MNFLQVAHVFEQIEQESSRTKITELLAGLLKQASAKEAQIIAYLSLGSLFPPYKIIQFNIAKKGMVDIIARLLEQDVQDVTQKLKEVGDVGSVVYNSYQSSKDLLTVEEVYESLVEAVHITGTGSTEKKYDHVVELLSQLDTVSAKYVVRVITGTLRLGFSDMTFLDALSWMHVGDKSIRKNLEHAFNICANLGLVAYTLKQDDLQGETALSIQVGIPIRPAAAERLDSAQAVIDKLGTSVAQPKLDGFRVQVHIKKDKNDHDIQFFSRNLLDMSGMFPDLQQAVLKLEVESLICEGEAIVFDEDTETFLPFQQTVKRKRKHDVAQASEELPLRFYIFDILYLNGMSLLDKTHKERRKALEGLFQNVDDNALHMIDEKKVTTGPELHDYFLLNIQGGLEGLVIKREDALYQPGKRNFNWIKLKRHARGKLVDTIDCVILGYYVGSGKRAKFGVGAFLVGLYNADSDMFETVAKIGTGMTDDEWKDLKKRCDVFKQEQKPTNIKAHKDLHPDVWVTPEIVCTIQSDEITQSPVHTAGKTDNKTGLALRFPRFITYREDKSAQDATTVTELHSLFDQQTSDNSKS